jgi:hypothetical protein
LGAKNTERALSGTLCGSLGTLGFYAFSDPSMGEPMQHKFPNDFGKI